MMDTRPAEDTLERTERRGNAYRLLSECFHEPDGELVELLEDVPESTKRAVDVDALRETVSGDVETLRVDYARLFVGPFELLASPYGSVYLDDRERVMTQSTLDVQRRYENEGLDVDIDEPPDHIAAELEFAYVLVCGELDALLEEDFETALSYQRKQQNFLETHLGAWLPEFANSILENAETDFYRELARETEAYVSSDLQYLSTKLEQATDLEDDELATLWTEHS